MKKIILGFITGIVFSGSIIGIFADEVNSFIAKKATFDVVVNGQRFDSDKPVVSIDGNTYLPLKDTGEALGVSVKWNSDLKRVEIGEAENTSISSTQPKGGSQMKVIGEYYIKSKLFETSANKFNLREIGGEYYLPVNSIALVKSDKPGDHYIQLPGKEPVYIKRNNNITSVAYRNFSVDPLIYIRLSALDLKAHIDGDTIWLE